MKSISQTLCVLLLVAWVSSPAVAQLDEDEVDHLAVATVLMRDGHYARALAELDVLGPEPTGVDRTRYYSLRGMIGLRQQDYAMAEVAFESAIGFGEQAAARRVKRETSGHEQGDPPPVDSEDDDTPALQDSVVSSMVWPFLAQARFSQEDFEGALAALRDGGEPAMELAGAWLLAAQSHWRLDDLPRAWEVIQTGRAKHPQVAELSRQQIFLAVELGLYQAALELGRAYLTNPRAQAVGADDYMAIGEALRQAKAFDAALSLLEDARLRFDGHPGLTRLLGRVYLDAGRTGIAARVFAEAARHDPQYALEAAELYRRAGRLIQALSMNALATDQARKVRQRLGLLLDAKRYAEAIALKPRMARLGLMNDDTLLYGLAYAHFQLGNFVPSERLLKRVTSESGFERATQLRQAMARCRDEGWTCY